MNYKRLTLLCGHYGSGKTNIAVNMALDMKKRFENVAVADLDIVNPYFRTKDSSELFKENGIRLIVSEYANSNLDIPALPDEMYALTDDRTMRAVLDIGGDDRGALALGRISPKIVEENDYEMLMVINKFRPLTPDAESTFEVMREIEAAGKIRFTGIINNSNLGDETTAQDVLESVRYAKEFSSLSRLPIVLTTVRKELYNTLNGKIENLFSLTLQAKPVD
ncbi:MAG: hypothetical protein K5755_00610 [Clostridiales bacterium]|nr:hypothetical protein [Clostridia bacterium]MCR4563129.1 hypothetical protein [Clostridiales bacterium]